MIVKELDRDWDVENPTFKQRRELHKLNARVWRSGEMETDAYYDLLERVREISGLKDRDFEGLSMVEVDQVLQAIFIEYLGLSKKD
jgi:hypothetical protein